MATKKTEEVKVEEAKNVIGGYDPVKGPFTEDENGKRSYYRESADYDPWQDMVEITLPRHPKNEQNFQFVAVNDRRFQVPRSGKPVAVPRPVYEALMNAAALRDFAAERKEQLASSYN